MEKTIGTINLTTGKVTITDPCYDKGTWCTAELENVHKGAWKATIDVLDCGDWGNRVDSLNITAVGESIIREELVHADIGVDAGVCGIFEDKPNYHEGSWGSVCDELLLVFGGLATKTNKFRCVGVWSDSGYGDGSYDAYVGYNKEGEIVSITIYYGVDGVDGVDAVTEDDDYSDEEEEDND